MGYSTDARHAETLAALAEALEYLERMPPVPVTRDMCRKIRAHLDDPVHRLVQANNDTTVTVRSGGLYTPWGMPLVIAKVTWPNEVLVWAPKPGPTDSYRRTSESLVRGVYGGGIRLELRREDECYPRHRTGGNRHS